MSKQFLLKKYTALFLSIALLVGCILSGCGKKPVDPTVNGGTSATTGATQGGTSGGESGGETGGESGGKTVKNVIFMIADGGGYDNFTLADQVKEKMTENGINKLTGGKTEVTTDLLAGIGITDVKGLYLDELLVGSANTLLQVPKDENDNQASYITDSAAAGTALSSGYKTAYTYVGIDADGKPRASITELARMNGMATGIVTTKSYVDATPLAFFTAHAIHRHQYQDTSRQALLSGIDVVIGEGTEYGDAVDVPSSHPDISTTSMGYTVARSKTQLLEKANDPATTKLWAPILGVYNSFEELKDEDVDKASDHISYDADAYLSTEQPSLLDMTKAALQVLGNNVNDPDGFFLMVEGGALDNAAEPGYLRHAVGEYLAFDEAFGYCVNWASQRGDTIVIAVPDHDSGGFSGIENCKDALIDSIISGYLGDEEFHNLVTYSEIKDALADMGENSENMALVYGHTEMAVPISLYAPESTENTLLTAMGLPTGDGDIRLGDSQYYVANQGDSLTWYTSSALNNDYTVENTVIAPAIASVLELGSLEEATGKLFNQVCHIDSDGNMTSDYGGSITFGDTLYETNFSEYYDCMLTVGGMFVERCSTGYTLNATDAENEKIGDLLPLSLFVLDNREDPKAGTFYVPATILEKISAN